MFIKICEKKKSMFKEEAPSIKRHGAFHGYNLFDKNNEIWEISHAPYEPFLVKSLTLYGFPSTILTMNWNVDLDLSDFAIKYYR